MRFQCKTFQTLEVLASLFSVGVTKLIDEFNNEFINNDTAEFINEYYTEAGPKLAQKMNCPWEPTECLVY